MYKQFSAYRSHGKSLVPCFVRLIRVLRSDKPAKECISWLWFLIGERIE